MPFDPATALFWLKKIASLLTLPPLAPLLVIGLGLFLAHRHRRTGLTLAWSGLALALALSSPYPVTLLLRPLENTPPVTLAAVSSAEAIVILGGGKRTHAPEYGGEAVNRLTLERLRFGARLARESGLPVLVTGGLARDGAPEAELMRTTLETDFGVNPRWIERASRDTRENAQLSAIHLKAAGIERIVLVTHAVHMPRAQAEFEAQGLQVVPAPTAWLGGNPESEELPSLLPTANAAYAGWLAVHEWLGRAAYRFTR